MQPDPDPLPLRIQTLTFSPSHHGNDSCASGFFASYRALEPVRGEKSTASDESGTLALCRTLMVGLLAQNLPVVVS